MERFFCLFFFNYMRILCVVSYMLLFFFLEKHKSPTLNQELEKNK